MLPKIARAQTEWVRYGTTGSGGVQLERVLAALGNRGYRDAHLEAGLIGGRTYLAAYALGRGATGLTFYDDDTTRFFSPHAAGKSPLLMVAVGIPHSSI
jgi:hypothetical protein